MADYTISSIVTPNGDVCHIKPYNLEVGARNLLRFSLNPTITYTGGSGGYQRKQTVAEWGCTNAFRVYGTSGSSRAFYIGGLTSTIANGKNVSESGQSYAMSVWVKNAHATNSVIVCTPLGGERTLAPGESARCAFVVEGDGLNNLEIDFKPTAPPSEYDVYFWHPKIEIGSVATDWLPAPEDADESYLALTGKPTEDQTPGFGEAVEVSQVKTDTGGRVTNLTTKTITIPNTLADATHNGLLSMLDWPKLQFNAIPKNIDLDTYALGMGMYFASSYIVSTLTHYPTSEESVLMCIGEPDYQYQIVIEVDTNTPKIYGRPVYFYEPRTAWKQLHWFDTATTSSDGLMSIADKTKVNRLEFTRIDASDTKAWATIGGKTANQALRVVRDQGAANSWVAAQYGPGISFGEADTHGYLGLSYASSAKPTLAMAGGSTANSTDAAPYWYMKLQGTSGNTYDLDYISPETSVTFASIRDTTNTTEASGTVRKIGKQVIVAFSARMAAVAANTWVTIATLASGYRPSEETFGTAATNTSSGNVIKTSVLTSGVIRIQSGTALSAGVVVRGTLTWFTA